jgi:hypothetical protein
MYYILVATFKKRDTSNQARFYMILYVKKPEKSQYH